MSRGWLLMMPFLILAATLLAGEGEDLLRAGRAALDDGVYELAQKHIDRYMKNYAGQIGAGEYEEVIVLQLRAMLGQKKYNKMLSLIGSVKPARIEDPGMLVYWKNLARYEMGDYENVLPDTDGYSDKYPGSKYSGDVERLRGWCWRKTGQVDRALASFAEYDRNYGDRPEAIDNLLEWAKLLISTGDNDGAVVVLERLAGRKDGGNAAVEGRFWLGRLYFERGMVDKSGPLLSSVALDEKVSGDTRAEAWYVLADISRQATNYTGAVVALSNGLQVATSPVLKQKGDLNLGRLYLGMNRIEDGVKLLKGYVAVNAGSPASGEVQLLVADSFLDVGRHKESVDEYQYYIETFTNATGLAHAHYGKGWGLISVGRYAESAASFMKSHDLFGDDVRKERALFKAGDAYFLNAQYTQAYDLYGKFVQKFPSSSQVVNALFQSGESLAGAGQYGQAEEIFERIIAGYSSDPVAENAMFRVAELKVRQNFPDEAIVVHGQLLTRYPSGKLVPDVLLGRGIVYFNQRKFEEALADFNRVVADFPESGVAKESRYRAGMSLYWLGRDVEAVKICESFVESYPESEWTPLALYWTGKYYFNYGDFKKAENVFMRFSERYPSNSLADDALLWAGHAMVKQREYVGAIELFARIAKDYPDSPKMADARFAQGEALWEIANYAAAVLIFDEIINKYPESYLVSEAWIRRGDSQFMLGLDNPLRYAEGMESYRVVAKNSDARLDLVMQAEYKTGRCLEKLGRTAESFDHYYQKVIIRFLEDREKGVWQNESCKAWFTSAAFKASGIAEGRGDFQTAVSMLDRVVKAGIESSPEAARKADKIKAGHWLLFYSDK